MSSEDKNKDSGYLKLSDDFRQLTHGFDGIEKAKGGLKILGKSFFNIGKFAVTEVLPRMAERMAEQAEKKKSK